MKIRMMTDEELKATSESCRRSLVKQRVQLPPYAYGWVWGRWSVCPDSAGVPSIHHQCKKDFLGYDNLIACIDFDTERKMRCPECGARAPDKIRQLAGFIKL